MRSACSAVAVEAANIDSSGNLDTPSPYPMKSRQKASSSASSRSGE